MILSPEQRCPAALLIPTPMNTAATLRLILLGDLHGHWNADDETYYTHADCDLLLWTGDLGNNPREQRAVARSLARCGTHALGILGNHDGASHLLASVEAVGLRLVTWCLSLGHARRVQQLHEILGPHDLSLRRHDVPTLGLSVVGLCPLQSRGGQLSFARTLQQVYGVTNLRPMLEALIDTAPPGPLILLGHNGPAGAGSEPFAPWGCDWRTKGGDIGDPLYREMIDRAQQQNKPVVLALAGHMHDRLHRRAGRTHREPLRFLGEVPLLNPCRVPRLEQRGDELWHWDYRAVLGPARRLQQIERVAWVASGEIRLREQIYP